jgi:hypothetical protein
VKKIGGMMIICFFVFCGFCHAFLVLDNGVPRIPGFPRPGHEAEKLKSKPMVPTVMAIY